MLFISSQRLARTLALTLALTLAFAPAAHATSVVPPSFPELVSEADAIYRGRVTASIARYVPRPDGGNVIKTYLTFAIDRVIKGSPQSQIILEFLGGTIGEDTLTVSGMPRFTIGSPEIIFVQKNGIQFCPLVAVMHGRYRILRDAAAGREFIARDNGLPLAHPSEVELPMTPLPAPLQAAAAAARGLTPASFEASITSELQRPSLRPRRN